MTKELNNIALCYHGMTSNVNEKSKYVTYIEDFKKQINHLKHMGYKFVMPSQFYKKYNSLVKQTPPIATIIFDDALESSSLATKWLADKGVPFGISIIGQRLGKLTPEEGFTSWKDIYAAQKSGLCEVLNHTYNLHQACLMNVDNKIVNAPLLDGPSYVDNGEFIYIADGNTGKYWNLDRINNVTWGFPVFGTDINTNKVIGSTVEFKASTSVTANQMRLWACLHNPYGSGYGVQLQIKINGTVVADCVIEPKNYDIKSQWPEREFVTIQFNNKYEIKMGKTYKIEFTTKNTGKAAFIIYAIPDFSGDFKLTTSCTNMTFPEYIDWPARACIILTDGTGKNVSIHDFQTYVKEDLEKSNQIISKYLNATWSTKTTGYDETNKSNMLVLGGTYSNGQLASTEIKIHVKETYTAEILRFHYASRLGNIYPLVMDILINDEQVGRFEANWWDWYSQEVEIESYQFIEGKDYIIKFETKNESPFGQGLVRVYMDQPKAPQPTWSQKLNKIVVPSVNDFNHEALYEVVNPEGSDIYPDGAVVNYESKFKWIINEPYNGPGKVFIDILSCTSGKVKLPTQIVYPFGAYYSTVISSSLVPSMEDVHIDLKSILTGAGIKSGFSVWEGQVTSLRYINLKYSEFIMPRYLIEGTTNQNQVLQNINMFTGSKDSILK